MNLGHFTCRIVLPFLFIAGAFAADKDLIIWDDQPGVPVVYNNVHREIHPDRTTRQATFSFEDFEEHNEKPLK